MTIEFIDSNHALFPQVKQLGKKYAATLGFMPEGGFDDYAEGRCVIIAREGDTLEGYLMYREVKRFSRVTIVHLVVDAPYRHNGIQTKLLDALRDKYQHTGLQGMALSCRKDYEAASAMWANYGFIAKGNKRSRSFDEHYLTMWWYGFQQRDLFTQAYEESTKVRALMDMNIIVKLRDAEKESAQLDPKEDPRCLLQDWLVDETELCYSPEVFNEINRDADLERMKETANYVTGAFTQVPVDAERVKMLALELKEYLPGSSPNAKSDRKQVATCIAAGIPYFITYDAEIVKKRYEISESFDVDIMTPQEFMMKIDQLLHREKYEPVLLNGVLRHTMNRLNSRGLQRCIEEFRAVKQQEKKLEFENVVSKCVNNEGEIFTIRDQEKDMAFCGVSSDDEGKIVHFVRVSEGPLSSSLFCQIMTDLLRSCVEEDHKRIVIKEQFLTEDQRSFLLNFGFLERGDGCFIKHIVNTLIDKDQIDSLLIDNGVFSVDRLVNPKNMEWTQEQMIRIEKVFYPLKILDMEIPCYIVPIKPYWAGQLFDSVVSGGQLFGADPSRLWSFENVYYRHTRPITEKSPARILWYESYDAKESMRSKRVVGCSYLTDVYTDKPKVLYKMFKHYGIYDWSAIYKLCNNKTDVKIRALKFSHTELFKYPIMMKEVNDILKKHGQGSSTFPSPLKVKKEVFFDLYRAGKGL